MKISHFIPYWGKAQGGPVQSASALAQAQAAAGAKVDIHTLHQTSDGERLPVGEEVGFHQYSCLLTAGGIRWAPGLAKRIPGESVDLVHSHGLWTWSSALADQVARRNRIPHVLAPCGMLQPGALSRSRFKKRIVKALFQSGVLDRVDCFHAKSDAEAEGIRSLFPQARIEIIPNPVTFEDHPSTTGNGGGNHLLFLGRLHPVKGLEPLIHAWADVCEEYAGWTLTLAGPDEGGYKQVLDALIESLNLGDRIRFTGPVEGEGKWELLSSAAGFVMPSDFENFGSAIVEALYARCPVVTTTGTPWKRLSDEKAGWWVPQDALPDALRELCAMSAEDRESYGDRAHQIASHFAPDVVATDAKMVYESLLSGLNS